jgi:hypothetical protein
MYVCIYIGPSIDPHALTIAAILQTSPAVSVEASKGLEQDLVVFRKSNPATLTVHRW